MKFKTFIVSTALLSFQLTGFTQDKSNVKFGKISSGSKIGNYTFT